MASMKTVLYLAACLSVWIVTPAEMKDPPKAEKLQWVSLDFKTVLKWTAEPSDFKFTVQFSEPDGNWQEVLDCTDISHMECDLTSALKPFDRDYIADIQTEPLLGDYDAELPHTESKPFNPYKQTNISTVTFNVKPVNDTTVVVDVTDPLSGFHEGSKQFTIRDILRNDLKYAISYVKTGSTGVREVISDFSEAVVSKLDAGDSYCFQVAAFIPSRPKANQLGPWSNKFCIEGDSVEGFSTAAWVGGIFILLVIIIIAVTVTVICCKRNQNHPNQLSAPI